MVHSHSFIYLRFDRDNNIKEHSGNELFIHDTIFVVDCFTSLFLFVSVRLFVYLPAGFSVLLLACFSQLVLNKISSSGNYQHI